MLASPASTTLQHLERLDVELQRVDRARRVLRLADRSRPEARARAVCHRVVERRTDDRHVHLASAELGRVGDPGQLHERHRPDVGRQVEVVERLEFAIPAVQAREVTVEIGVVGALGHGAPPETVAAAGRHGRSVSFGRRRFEGIVQRGASRDRTTAAGLHRGGLFVRCRVRAFPHARTSALGLVLPSAFDQPRPAAGFSGQGFRWNSCQAAATSAGSANSS